MDILTTRTLTYTDEVGEIREVILTVFKPFEIDSTWKIEFVMSPPLQRRRMYGTGEDVLQALSYMLCIANAYVYGTDYRNILHWKDRPDIALVDSVERPASWTPPEIPAPRENPGNLEVFSTRTVGMPDENGVEHEVPLTVFLPFQSEDGKWKCGFAFGPPRGAPIYEGVGDDFIEAFLDAAALARVIYEQKLPKDWVSSMDRPGCEYLPYKIGRSFYLDVHRD